MYLPRASSHYAPNAVFYICKLFQQCRKSIKENKSCLHTLYNSAWVFIDLYSESQLPISPTEDRFDRNRQMRYQTRPKPPGVSGRSGAGCTPVHPPSVEGYDVTLYLAPLHQLCVGFLCRSFIRKQSFGRQPPTSRIFVVGLMPVANRHLHVGPN